MGYCEEEADDHPITAPVRAIPFENLLNICDRAMAHGLSIVLEELMDEADYEQYIMCIQFLHLKGNDHER
jgi:hypothetical protein